MNERILLDSIGQVDESLLSLCDEKPKPQRWRRVAKRAALFFLLIGSLAGIVLLTVPEARAWLDRQQKAEEEVRDYIQLPPELTSWSEPSADGTSTTAVGIVRNGKMYLLTLDEYHAITKDGADADEVLSRRDEWAAQWKGYEPPAP